MAKRVRLSPHDRKMQLLDCAGRILLDHGLSKFTIDALAKEATVSTPLIYKYFDTRIEILQALLVRESEQFAAKLRDLLDRSMGYEEIVRLFVTLNFDTARSGNLLKVLLSQPDVKKGLDSTDFDWVSQVLFEKTAQEFGLSLAQAKQVVPMGSAASQTAAGQFSRRGGDREQAIDDTVKFILGAFRAVSANTAQS